MKFIVANVSQKSGETYSLSILTARQGRLSIDYILLARVSSGASLRFPAVFAAIEYFTAEFPEQRQTTHLCGAYSALQIYSLHIAGAQGQPGGIILADTESFRRFQEVERAIRPWD